MLDNTTSEENKYVLYMEDDVGLGRLMQKRLEKHSYIVEVVHDGHSGLQRAIQKEYDVILVDYNMPGMCGLEVIHAINVSEVSPPVIMLTGGGNERVAVEALKFGAADYIIKDTDMKYLELMPTVLKQSIARRDFIREREELLKQVKESEFRYRRLVEMSPEGIAIIQKRKFVFINQSGIDILSGAEGDIIGKDVFSFIPERSKDLFNEHLELMIEENERPPRLEEQFIKCNNEIVDIEMSGISFTYKGHPATQILFKDISERKIVEKQLEQQAHYDNLTRLANRVLFTDRTNKVLAQATRQEKPFSIMFIDLDKFKNINDTYGHDAGDEVLKVVAERLLKITRSTDTVARLGGDEFAIVLSAPSSIEDTEIVATRAIEVLCEPIPFNNNIFNVGGSIGISTYPQDGKNIDELIKKADIAMYWVKRDGRNGYKFFKPNTNTTNDSINNLLDILG